MNGWGLVLIAVGLLGLVWVLRTGSSQVASDVGL